MLRGDFTLHDFIAQMSQVQSPGRMKMVMGKIPGLAEMIKTYESLEADIERQIKGFKAIYQSMTPEERKEPEIITSARRRRIARGAGVEPAAVSSFLQQFEQARNMMRAVGGIWPRRNRASVLALVTDNPRVRDPSYVYDRSPNWRLMFRALTLIALAAVAAIACSRLLQWISR